MKFTKMHGCGNDYVYVNCLEEKINNPNTSITKTNEEHALSPLIKNIPHSIFY